MLLLLLLTQEVKQSQSGGNANMQQHDPSASWALQQFWQRSAPSQAPRPSPALHPPRESLPTHAWQLNSAQ